MARIGAARALELLHQVSREAGIDVPSLQSTMAIRPMAMARREFVVRAVAEDIPWRTIAATINRCHTTVMYHARPYVQERKRAWHKIRREAKACRAS